MDSEFNLSLQLQLPEDKRVYCSKCKILLADVIIRADLFTKKPFCDNCKPKGKYVY